MILYLLCKTDLSTSEEQHTTIKLNVVVLHNFQIFLTAVVSIHQLALCARRANSTTNKRTTNKINYNIISILGSVVNKINPPEHSQ